tara:strand:+ start:234 stop:380 length:147 start_codon:yes stop_codon:yes gene_type:complete
MEETSIKAGNSIILVATLILGRKKGLITFLKEIWQQWRRFGGCSKEAQ